MRLVIILALLAVCLPIRADSPVADAAEKLDRATIRALLAGKADVNSPQIDGMTALHWAVHKDDIELVKDLIRGGANVQATNRYGIPPLHLACVNGHAAIVEALLAAGADANTTIPCGETVLMTAARTGNVEPVKALLARGAKVEAREKHGQTALMWAAHDGHAEVVDLLIKSGADFKTPLDGGFTPLFFAAREGRLAVVKTLIKAGANVNEAMEPKKRAGRGPQPGTTPLLIAVENGHFELAIALVEAGADPNDQRGGYTALHNVIWVRKPSRGDDDDGQPPPNGSGSLSSLQFVRKIVSLGADVNPRIKKGPGGRGALNRTGATPFLLASQTDDLPLMKLLVELGADPTIPNADGATPLMAAAGLGTLAPDEVAGDESEALDCLNYLLGLRADINVVDKNGETAMHGAAYKSLPKVVQFLADHGAKIEVWNQKDKYGWTPLLLAQGYRPGNFKPSYETVDAIKKVMLAAGVTPPEPPLAKEINNTKYAPAQKVLK